MRKTPIIVVKLRYILIAIVMLSLVFIPKQEVATPVYKYTVVIDAGHGGIDGGCVGKSGVTESELNLQYTFALKEYCEEFGINVVLTREDMNGLYSSTAKNKKKSEMAKREEVINESDCDIVISIHMNSVRDRSVSGAQVFYKKDNEQGRDLANTISQSLDKNEICIKGEGKVGDFYVLNCNNKPAVLIECGFLSNSVEEYRLCDENYRKKFCESTFFGILNFLKM